MIDLRILFIFVIVVTACSNDIKVDFLSSSESKTPVHNIECPTNYVAVFGNGTLGTTDFCVMKYEAKNDGGGVATSSPTGNPWISITADDGVANNDNDAFEKCSNIVIAGFSGTFSLISNAQWMSIARDIESLDSNWSGASVGSGFINQGWSANSTDDAFENNGVALNSTTACTYNTGSDTCGATGSFKYKRTHLLSTGEEIWDMAGNIYEWVDWDGSNASFDIGPLDGDTGGWNEINDLVGSVTSDDVQSLGPYTSVHEVGRFYPATSGGAARRGGDWDDGQNGGIYSLALNISPTSSSIFWGFRCVYKP